PILPSDPDCPAEVVHGTYPAAWAKILETGGLSRMGRGHVHFAVGLPGASSSATAGGGGGGGSTLGTGSPEIADASVATETEHPNRSRPSEKHDTPTPTPDAQQPIVSGMRASASVLVWVDVKRSMAEGGLKWWRSANGVVLTEGDERGLVRLEFVTKAAERGGGGGVLWPAGGVEHNVVYQYVQ
ncbi:MAG: hypothetical protein LQ340_008050, partial [Diploschistes diacapsis]